MDKQRRQKLLKEVTAALIIGAIVLFCTGFWAGMATCHWLSVDTAEATDVTELDTEEVLEVSYLTCEMSTDWGEVDSDFTPLDVDMDEYLQEYIYCLSKGYDIDFYFVMAIIQQESNYDSDAVSGTGDYGLMQINEINFDTITETIGVTDFLNPYDNVRAGLWLLRNLLDKYNGNTACALMAYNLGEAGAKALWNEGIYETSYTKSVIAIQAEMEGF